MVILSHPSRRPSGNLTSSAGGQWAAMASCKGVFLGFTSSSVSRCMVKCISSLTLAAVAALLISTAGGGGSDDTAAKTAAAAAPAAAVAVAVAAAGAVAVAVAGAGAVVLAAVAAGAVMVAAVAVALAAATELPADGDDDSSDDTAAAATETAGGPSGLSSLELGEAAKLDRWMFSVPCRRMSLSGPFAKSLKKPLPGM